MSEQLSNFNYKTGESGHKRVKKIKKQGGDSAKSTPKSSPKASPKLSDKKRPVSAASSLQSQPAGQQFGNDNNNNNKEHVRVQPSVYHTDKTIRGLMHRIGSLQESVADFYLHPEASSVDYLMERCQAIQSRIKSLEFYSGGASGMKQDYILEPYAVLSESQAVTDYYLRSRLPEPDGKQGPSILQNVVDINTQRLVQSKFDALLEIQQHAQDVQAEFREL
ncbi:hypothetical protein MIR68_011158 [Amoeboaphelidium protococcarum]|nr:hypothetical protein MIR68_011158 [Amoeboaphelidium protococcarum]